MGRGLWDGAGIGNVEDVEGDETDDWIPVFTGMTVGGWDDSTVSDDWIPPYLVWGMTIGAG